MSVAPPEATGPTLYLVPNLLGAVAPERVLPAATIERIRALTAFVVETPKIARQFLKTAGHPRPIAELALATLDEHTRPEALPDLLDPLRRGVDLGLLSDAGCPGIADPGSELVALAHRRGFRVVPLVGPSAVLLALMASGFSGQGFAFHGYLPVDLSRRVQALQRLEAGSRSSGHTQLFIETPYRNEAMVAGMSAALAPGTRVCLATDLTLPTETIVSTTIAELARRERRSIDRRPTLFLITAART